MDDLSIAVLEHFADVRRGVLPSTAMGTPNPCARLTIKGQDEPPPFDAVLDSTQQET